MSRSLLEGKELGRATYSDVKDREAPGLFLEIPNILVQLEGRGPAKVGCER